MKATHHPTLRVVAIAAVALLTVACSSDESTSTTVAGTAASATTVAGGTETVPATDAVTTTEAANPYEGELVGTFAIDAGACAGGAVSGSYFQMVQPLGNATDGPFIPNADSACADDPNYTLLAPGAAGGLVTGDWQAAPDPAFDATGNGLANDIVEPVTFFAVAFAAATDPNEAAPSVTATNGVLSADLSAFTAYYGAGVFNQGAPKPDGSGDAPTGTIDPETGAFTLEWTSLIAGGSFDGFTGVWHLEGTFTPAA